MTEAIILGLIAQCAPNVAPDTMMAIIRTESAGKPWAIGVNKGRAIRAPKSKDEATAAAKKLARQGSNFDMGLAQINSANLKWLGLSIDDVFEPCTNIRAGAFILTNNYRRAKSQGLEQPLLAALSAYNTGSFTRGLRNGYVRKVLNNTAKPPPSLHENQARSFVVTPDPEAQNQSFVVTQEAQKPPEWDVFGRARWRTEILESSKQEIEKGTSYELSLD